MRFFVDRDKLQMNLVFVDQLYLGWNIDKLRLSLSLSLKTSTAFIGFNFSFPVIACNMYSKKYRASYQQHAGSDYNWFFKADDDTYVIVENLRHMLEEHNPEDPLFFGFHLNISRDQQPMGFMSGGAGYVLSREALRLFIKIMNTTSKCRRGIRGNEDVEIAWCLYRAGVKFGDSRDKFGRNRFIPIPLQDQILVNKGHAWEWDYAVYRPPDGFLCCSERIISIHYVSGEQMYLIEYLIYHLKIN